MSAAQWGLAILPILAMLVGIFVGRTVGEALPLAWQLPCPVAITVDETDKYPRVIDVELGERTAAVTAAVCEGTPAWLAEKLRAA